MLDRIPACGSYAAKIGLMGPVESGQLAKMVNQICIAGVVHGLAEGLHFARKAGLDIDKLVDVISQGAAGSWQMRNRSQTMKEGRYDFGFAVNWVRKDLGLALDEATRNGAALPLLRSNSPPTHNQTPRDGSGRNREPASTGVLDAG